MAAHHSREVGDELGAVNGLIPGLYGLEELGGRLVAPGLGRCRRSRYS